MHAAHQLSAGFDYLHTAMTASRLIAWRTAIAEPPPPGHRPACAPELRTEEEAVTWLRTERPNLHACVDYAASHTRLGHAAGIPVAISDFMHARGYWSEALNLGQVALAAARTVGDRQGQACALNQLGIAQELTGDYPAAAASQTEALQLFRDIGDRHGQAEAAINLGELRSLSSAHDDARGYYARALSIALDINAPDQEARSLEGIGRSHIQEGSPGQGAVYLRQALAIYRRIGAPEAQRVETTLQI